MNRRCRPATAALVSGCKKSIQDTVGREGGGEAVLVAGRVATRKKRGRSGNEEGDKLRTRTLRVRHFMNARRNMRVARRTYARHRTFIRIVNVASA